MKRKLLRTRDKDKSTIVVLYKLLDNAEMRWVTWIAPKDAPANTFWGHYFNNEVDAVHDFENR